MEDVKESKIEENSCTTNDDGEADEMCEADEKCEVNESEDVEMVDAEANSEAEANSIDAEANSVDAEANSVDAEANSVDAEANSVDAETNSVDAEGNSQDAKKVCDVEKNDTKPSEPVVPETHTHTTRLKTGTITLKPVTERKKRHKRLRRFSNRSSSSSSSSIGNHLKNSESIGRENLRPRRQRTVPDSELNGSISSESEDYTKHSKNGKNNGSASCSDQAIEIKEIDQLENKIRDYMEMKFKKDTPELRERLCSDEKIPQSKDAINKSEDKPQTIIVTETKSLAQVINNAVRKDMCSSQEGKPTLVIIETKTPAAEISSLPKTQTVTNTITVETGLGKSNMSGSLTSVPLGTSSQMKSMYNASNGGSAAASAVEDGGMAVEVPSLVVPYLIEYPPSRTISEFLKMLPLNAQELKEIEEASKTKSYGNYLSSPSGPISTVGSSQPYGAYGNPIGRPKTADRWGAYFESSLGKFFVDIGLNLAKEWVQNDLVKSQRRKIEKQIKPGQQEINMGALMKTLEETKEKNDPYHFSLKKCQICNFKTESLIVMKNHYSYPHEKHMDYLCNFCKFRTRLPQAAKFHMEAEHGVQARLERPICFYHCPLCEFEDNSKGKVTKHSFKCQKKFIPERNMAPPPEFDPPAKRQKVFPIVPPGMSSGATNKYNVPVSSYAQKSKLSIRPKDMKMPMSGGYRQMNCGGNNMGNMYYRSGNMMYPQSSSSRGSMSQSPVFLPSNQPLVVNQMLQSSQQYQSNQIYQVLNNSGHMMPVVGGNINQMSNPRFTLLPTASNNSSSMQGPTPVALVPNIATSTPSRSVLMSGGMGSSSQRIQTPKPNISITPVTKSSAPQSRTRLPTPSTSMVKLGAQNSSFVVCEICDGYIKDLEQLRTHMQWIHKVKIHPKMIFNRPPLNCQKCQFRFFTDQGLERHLLGAHGLVTSSMQENANKGQDSGRCTICGKVFQWKLLAHMSKDHNMILKPAHLSYKCTVCAATFGMYKLFETHVYQAHSTVAKRVLDTPDEKKKPQQNVKPDTKADSSPLTVHLECSECGEKFAKKANLMQHWEKHHLGEKKETKRNDNDDEEDDDDDDKDDVAVIEMETNSREKETTEDGDQDETALDMEVESHDVEHPSPCSVHTDEEEVDGDDEEDDDDGGQC